MTTRRVTVPLNPQVNRKRRVSAEQMAQDFAGGVPIVQPPQPPSQPAPSIPMTPFELANRGASAAELEAASRPAPRVNVPGSPADLAVRGVRGIPSTLIKPAELAGATVAEVVEHPGILLGQESPTEKRTQELRKQGMSYIDARIQAARETTDLPPGVVGASEVLFDPLNFIPGLGPISRGGLAAGRAGAQAAGAVARNAPAAGRAVAQATGEGVQRFGADVLGAGAPTPQTAARRVTTENLPRELAGAKPRYNIGNTSYQPAFQSDTDKALFIVAQTNRSRQDAAYMAWLQRRFPNIDEAGIRKLGSQVRQRIKQLAQTQGEGGALDIPPTGIGVRSTAPVRAARQGQQALPEGAASAQTPPTPQAAQQAGRAAAEVSSTVPGGLPARGAAQAADTGAVVPSGAPSAQLGREAAVPASRQARVEAAQSQVQQWQEQVLAQGGSPLPSGRIPGGPRAQPLGAQPPPPPPTPPAPPSGGLPSGRVPGGPGRATPPPPRDPFEQLQSALTPERQPLLSKIRAALPREFYDRNFVLKRLENETGIPAHRLAQVVPGSQGAAEDILRRNQLPVVNRVGKDAQHLEQYMLLMRAQDLLSRFPGTRLPGGFTGWGQVNDALDALRRRLGTQRFSAIEEAANDLWRMNDELGLQALRREGILSGEAYLAMKTTHPHYIPFQRADFVDTLHQSFTKPEASVSSTGIKTINPGGSEKALDRPLERLLGEMHKTQGVIFRNRAAKGIVDALEEMQRTTGIPFVRRIEPKGAMNVAERVTGERLPRMAKAEHSNVWDTISYYQDGVKHTVEIPAEYAQVAKGLEAQPDNVLLHIIRTLNAPLRHGAITYNPFFTPVNIMRDAMAAMFREKVIPFGPDHLAGMWAAISKNSLFSEAAQSGALMSGIVENMSAPVRGGSKVLTQGALQVKKPMDALLFLPRLINEVNLVAERGARLGTFRQLRREGITPLEAAVRARDVTVDFAKAGNTMRVINQVIPFTNAAVQGQANMLRTLRDHPTRSAAIGALFLTPTILARLNNQRYETSDLIPDYEYSRNWVIQVGEGTRKDGTQFPVYIKIPKGEIAGMFSFPAEALFNLARETEDRSAAELFLSAGIEQAQNLSPVDPALVPPVPFIQTGVGLGTGIDTFTGAPIVPRSEQNLLPEQQFGEDTSAAAIAIGQKLGISPRMIDFAINDYVAGAGQFSNWLLSSGMEALGFTPERFGEAVDEPSPEGAEAVSRVPGVGRFIGTRDTQTERRGWDVFNQAVEETNRDFSQIEGMNRLGVRLGEAGSSINNQELTPAQRARYQRIYADLVLEGLPSILPQVRGTDEQQRTILQGILSGYRDQARGMLMQELQSSTQRPTQDAAPTPGRKRRVSPEEMAQDFAGVP